MFKIKLLILFRLQVTMGFLGNNRNPFTHHYITRSTCGKRSLDTQIKNSLKMISPDFAVMACDPYQMSDVSSIFSDGKDTARYSSFERIVELAKDPKFESAAFRDMSHLALDLMMFFSPEASIIARSFTVFGRVLSMASDYVPDHYMAPDELSFQLAMLVRSIQLLIKTATPILKARSFYESQPQSNSTRNKRTYCSLFRPIGLSWGQFETVTANALEWVEFGPNETIYSSNDDIFSHDFIYWLYDGSVKQCNCENITRDIQKRKAQVISDTDDIGLLGNVQYEGTLRIKNKSRTFIEEPRKKQDVHNFCQETIKAGDEGATLLRINTAKLSELTREDKALSEVIQLLLVKDIQKKMSAGYGSILNRAKIRGKSIDQN